MIMIYNDVLMYRNGHRSKYRDKYRHSIGIMMQSVEIQISQMPHVYLHLSSFPTVGVPGHSGHGVPKRRHLRDWLNLCRGPVLLKFRRSGTSAEMMGQYQCMYVYRYIYIEISHLYADTHIFIYIIIYIYICTYVYVLCVYIIESNR